MMQVMDRKGQLEIMEAGFSNLEVLSTREFYVEDSDNKEMVKLLSITVRAEKH